MREIKYRALAKVTYNYETHNSRYKIKEGDWVFGYYYRDVLDNEDSCSYFHVNYIRIEYGDHYGDIEVEGDTVGQFTGIKDNQGVDIYDGDILEDEEHNRREVYWSSDNLAWYCTNCFCSLSEVADTCKVIGNFYQNPELLDE